MKLKRITIREASYKVSDIPKEFTVVLDLNKDKDLQGLKSRRLKGIVGLSGKDHVKYYRVNYEYNAVLIMDANEVLKINKLSRVMYDNPDYFFSNNMKALDRVTNYRDEKRLIKELIEWISQHLVKKLCIITIKSISDRIDINQINSIKDLWRLCKNISQERILYFKEQGNKIKYDLLNKFTMISYEDFKDIVKKVININIKNEYHYEAEWIVKGGILNIPEQSKLILMTNNSDIKNNFDLGLDKIYNLKFADIKTWKQNAHKY